jgi:hypothetical protein
LSLLEHATRLKIRDVLRIIRWFMFPFDVSGV